MVSMLQTPVERQEDSELTIGRSRTLQVIDKGHNDQLESPRAMPKGSDSLIERDTIDFSSGEVKVDPSFNSEHIRTPASQMSDGSTDNDIADSAKELKALTVKNNETGLEVSSFGATGADASGSSGSPVDAIIKKKPVQRTKVPFEKGYSQMDWLRITRTHPDLAGLKGQSNRRMISMDEVKQHKGQGSIWTVLRGRVYNITPYLKFHPGGVDMLIKAAGRDCTSLFSILYAALFGGSLHACILHFWIFGILYALIDLLAMALWVIKQAMLLRT